VRANVHASITPALPIAQRHQWLFSHKAMIPKVGAAYLTTYAVASGSKPMLF
jgi:hypothetical protein